MEFMLNHGSILLEQGIVFPTARRYKLRSNYPLDMTAKGFWETLKQNPISSIFPNEEFKFGELVEIDDGIKSYCFYYAAEKGFVYAHGFQATSVLQQNAGGRKNDKKSSTPKAAH